MSKSLRALVVAVATTALAATAGSADETVDVGGSKAVLLRPAAPSASVILMPGGDGQIGVAAGGVITGLKNNQLVRTRNAYRSRGLAVLVANAGIDLKQAVDYMAAIKRPVIVIGTSRGTLRAAQGIARGARPDALVLTSGFLTDASGSHENVANILGSPDKLPRTLVIHHRRDTCRYTLPAGVEPFLRWAGGRASVKWVEGGANDGNPCRARSHHGFAGLDGQVVSLAAGFR